MDLDKICKTDFNASKDLKKDLRPKVVVFGAGVAGLTAAHELAARSGVEMPITAEIHALLYEGKSARDAIADLLSRERKHERG